MTASPGSVRIAVTAHFILEEPIRQYSTACKVKAIKRVERGEALPGGMAAH
jgi:hypothetical protein